MKQLIKEAITSPIKDFVRFFLTKLEQKAPSVKNKFTVKKISNLTDDDYLKIWTVLTNKGGKNLGKLIWDNKVIDASVINNTFDSWINRLNSASSKEERIKEFSDLFDNANILSRWMRSRGSQNISKEVIDADRYINSKLEELFLKKLKNENESMYKLYVNSAQQRLQSKIGKISSKWDEIDSSEPLKFIEKITLSDSFFLKTMRSAIYETFQIISKKEYEIFQKIEENLKTLTKGTLSDIKPVLSQTYLLASSLKKFKKFEIDGFLDLMEKEIVKVLRQQGSIEQVAIEKAKSVVDNIKKSNPYDAERWDKIFGTKIKEMFGQTTEKVVSFFFKSFRIILNTMFLGVGNLTRLLAKNLSKYGVAKGSIIAYCWLQGQKIMIVLALAIVKVLYEITKVMFGDGVAKTFASRLRDSVYETLSGTYIGDNFAETVWRIMLPVNFNFFFDRVYKNLDSASRGEIKVDTDVLQQNNLRRLDSLGKVYEDRIKELDSLSRNRLVNQQIIDTLPRTSVVVPDEINLD